VTVGRRWIIWLGGAAMLAATATDTLAVLGRNLGLPLVGSIEIVQAAVLVSGIAALVLATGSDEHARVKILTRRLTGSGRSASRLLGAIAAAILVGALAAGSIWVAADLWHASERSELLGIPWRWLRLVANAGLLACAALSLAALARAKEG
jgi:TRAP-type C4-dicarboxylate transport system permease small subunit